MFVLATLLFVIESSCNIWDPDGDSWKGVRSFCCAIVSSEDGECYSDGCIDLNFKIKDQVSK